ncbi:MAG: diacylglycerol kinase family lipid kinase [Anaerolineales bacterium]|nr:diacylglycerol kinase family lipid kinase [Anaerolineales bacterium]
MILNPEANQGRGRRFEAPIRAAAARHGELTLRLTQAAGEAEVLARQAAEEGYDVVVAAGGDGTVHEVVNGLYTAQAAAALGVIPIGSGNDFAYANGIAAEVETAVARLFGGRARTVDLGRIEDGRGRTRVFDNNFGLGFDARVVVETQKVTRVHGFMMYLTAVLRTLLYYYDRPRIVVEFDGEAVAQAVLFLAMGIGPRGGGGFLLVPDARADDDLIDSCTVNPIGRLQMLWMIPKTLKGTHVTSPHVTMRRSRRICIEMTEPAPIHIDGEIFCNAHDGVRQVTVTSLPGALRVMV